MVLLSKVKWEEKTKIALSNLEAKAFLPFDHNFTKIQSFFSPPHRQKNNLSDLRNLDEIFCT